MKEKILIIEDEEELVKGLKLNLVIEGYDVIWALDGEDGFNKALKEAPDMILLDIMLPKKDGLDVCRELRRRNVSIPIIMLTAKGEEVDRSSGWKSEPMTTSQNPSASGSSWPGSRRISDGEKMKRKASLPSIDSMTSKSISFILRSSGAGKSLT
jgi:CheY-like chemotaxis protein